VHRHHLATFGFSLLLFTGPAHSQLAVVDRGKSSYRIVLPEAAIPSNDAAEELRDYLERSRAFASRSCLTKSRNASRDRDRPSSRLRKVFPPIHPKRSAPMASLSAGPARALSSPAENRVAL
jgi:hypothetical protein